MGRCRLRPPSFTLGSRVDHARSRLDPARRGWVLTSSSPLWCAPWVLTRRRIWSISAGSLNMAVSPVSTTSAWPATRPDVRVSLARRSRTETVVGAQPDGAASNERPMEGLDATDSGQRAAPPDVTPARVGEPATGCPEIGRYLPRRGRLILSHASPVANRSVRPGTSGTRW